MHIAHAVSDNIVTAKVIIIKVRASGQFYMYKNYLISNQTTVALKLHNLNITDLCL